MAEGEKDSTNQTRTVDFTYDELLEQNRSLSEELVQCRADKDFVWTLWKRLQAEKPDVSSVVSMVVLREKEKSEAKDNRVLGILKEKDNNIKILEEIAADLEVQLKQSMERLSGLLVAQSEWQAEMDQLKIKNSKLKEENEYQQQVMKAIEIQKQNELASSTERIEKLENLNNESGKRIVDLETEVDKLSKETSVAATLMETNSVLRDKIKVLEKDLELTKKEYNEKISILESRESQLLAETELATDQREQIEEKEIENSSLRMEVKRIKDAHKECLNHLDEQSEIIRNLELLQDETQQVLRNQQDSHKAEVGSYKITLNELRMKCIEMQSTNEKLYGESEVLKQSLSLRLKEKLTKEDEIMKLEKTLSERSERIEGFDSETQTVDLDYPGCRQSEERIENLTEQLEYLQDLLHEKIRRISSLEKVLGGQEPRRFAANLYPSENQENNMESDEEKTSETKIRGLNEELKDMNELIALKENELKETRKAHDQRLNRYKTLQKNYSIVTKQLRTYEQEPTAIHLEPDLRSDPRSLQHENSDSVWNELAFFKKQYKSLKNKRDDVDEEIDSLRVENSHHLSTIKQLKIYLQQERYELQKLRSEIKSKQRMVSPSKISSMEKQMEILRKRARGYEENLEEMIAENEALRQRESYYKAEVTSLTDEIDHIHKNIKDKIDAEVQASDMIEGLERQANQSLEKIAKTIASQTDNGILEGSPVRRKRYQLMEKTSQTSPWSPFHKRHMTQHVSQSTQTSDDHTSSDNDTDSTLSPRDNRSKPGNPITKKNKAGQPMLILNDLKTPKRKYPKDKRRKSPGHVMLPQKRKALPPNSSPVAREQMSLKLRVQSLQQQIQVLRDSKLKLSQNLTDQQKANEITKEELGIAMKKMEMNKITIQKLSDELEKCIRCRDELEKELGKERKRPRVPEIGYQEMENRWKLATTECSKLSFQVRTLRGENDMMGAKHKEFRERILRLERQLQQKKDIVDELREKLKEHLTASTKDKESLDEIKKKNKDLLVKEEQRKNYVEDLKNKINKISSEQLQFQEKIQLTQEELNRKSRLLQQSQELCNQAEKAVNEMEKAAYDQLQEQALQHEKLQVKFNEQLNKENKRIKEYQFLIKCFVEEQLKEIHRMRISILAKRKKRLEEEKRIQSQKESMVHAKDIACSILDMSSEDLQAFMEDDNNDTQMIEANDNEFRARLDEYLKRENKFTKPLLRCLLELISQNWELRFQEYEETNSVLVQNKQNS